MPEFLATNAGRVSTGQGVKGGKGEQTGRVRMLYDERAFTTEALAADTIRMGGLLPAGARIISGRVISPDVGGTGTLSFGHQANGVDAATPAALGSGIDNSGQAVDFNCVGVAIGKRFAAATQFEILFSGNTASLTGKTIQAWILYVVD